MASDENDVPTSTERLLFETGKEVIRLRMREILDRWEEMPGRWHDGAIKAMIAELREI